MLLFAGVCGVMLLKKCSESPPRSWACFLGDTSKQVCGAGWIHLMNIVFSVEIHRSLSTGDQCAWYWINIVVDCTVGVFIEYVLLQLSMRLLVLLLGAPRAEQYRGGSYYQRAPCGKLCFRWELYFKQLALWIVVVTLMKLSVLCLLFFFKVSLVMLAETCLSVVQGEQAKLVAVMIVTPFVMNAFQFWVVDGFIKRQEDEKGTHVVLLED
jgi:hypothetical protein